LSARNKLNVAYVNGAVLMAGLLVIFSGNPTVFVVALGVFLAAAVHSGGIRPGRRR
jgi:hypothetical protein